MKYTHVSNVSVGYVPTEYTSWRTWRESNPRPECLHFEGITTILLSTFLFGSTAGRTFHWCSFLLGHVALRVISITVVEYLLPASLFDLVLRQNLLIDSLAEL